MSNIFGTVGSLLRDLGQAAKPYFRPTTAVSKLPGPKWAPSFIAPTSTAGSILGLLQLEGSTPQQVSPDRAQKVSEFAGKEGMWGRYAPAQYRYKYNINEGTAPPGAVPPVPDPNASLFRGPQAGQLTPPTPSSLGTGGMSNGAGVPALRKNVQDRALSQEVLNAAQQYAAPTSVPLSAFYEGQQQLGRSMLKDQVLQRQLQDLGGATGMTPEALNQWATANPGAAYRLLEKLKTRPQ